MQETNRTFAQTNQLFKNACEQAGYLIHIILRRF